MMRASFPVRPGSPGYSEAVAVLHDDEAAAAVLHDDAAAAVLHDEAAAAVLHDEAAAALHDEAGVHRSEAGVHRNTEGRLRNLRTAWAWIERLRSREEHRSGGRPRGWGP